MCRGGLNIVGFIIIDDIYVAGVNWRTQSGLFGAFGVFFLYHSFKKTFR